jgi:hypothetical protein
MSTRIFLLDRDRFAQRVGALALLRPPRGTYPKRERHPRYAPAETCFSAAMHARSLMRLNLLGRFPGLWYVHPGRRPDEFYAGLPSVVERVERGDTPAAQLGDDELIDSMLDRSSTPARSARRPIWQSAVPLARTLRVRPRRRG